MSPIIRNGLAAVAGVAAGSVVNMALVNVGPSIIPIPDGADISTPEGLSATIHLFSPANFIFPFLAHAIGTLAGAFVAARLAVSYGMKIAVGLGVFFLIGGVVAAVMFGGPTWFVALDLVFAYLPMAYLGGHLGLRVQARSQ